MPVFFSSALMLSMTKTGRLALSGGYLSTECSITASPSPPHYSFFPFAGICSSSTSDIVLPDTALKDTCQLHFGESMAFGDAHVYRIPPAGIRGDAKSFFSALGLRGHGSRIQAIIILCEQASGISLLLRLPIAIRPIIDRHQSLARAVNSSAHSPLKRHLMCRRYRLSGSRPLYCSLNEWSGNC